MRIVSLLPSATEIVYALGVDDQLVGVTFECNEPARARVDKRVVVGGADTSVMSVAEIDAYVRRQLAAGENLYTLDQGALAELAPDLILSQDLCRVCAIPPGQVDAALEHLGCAAEVVTLDPYSLEEVLDSIRAVARVAGASSRGEQLVAALETRLSDVRSAVSGRDRARVAVVEWVDPLFTGGHWIPDQIEAAGGIPVGGHPRQASRASSWDELRAERPEVVFVAPCGFGLDGAAAQAEIVARELPDAAVWAIDGDAVIVRPGPRLVDGVEAMAAVLHPDAVGPSAYVRPVRVPALEARNTVAT
ncbi:MAG: iron complex transport system substrate-binding protein [Nocardioidaceae bacterium]|nr:iron complex transport system substrate-binding protein [Nocardioidaceae bacterium]